MQIKRYFRSAIFSGLFVTASALSPALGQEKTMEPQGAWAITKIDRISSNGNSYCTLSRKYKDGTVVSVGRNTTEEYSLAVDFQKDIFTKDTPVKIALQPGPGQTRSYDLMPASQKALVVRLGWDDSFFKTLNQSQSLKVTLDDKAYAFKFSGISQGQKDLSQCMEGLKQAAKDSKTTTPQQTTKDVLAAQPMAKSPEFVAGKESPGKGETATHKANVIEANAQGAEKESEGFLGKILSNVVGTNAPGAQTLSKDEQDSQDKKNFASSAPSKIDTDKAEKKDSGKYSGMTPMANKDSEPAIAKNEKLISPALPELNTASKQASKENQQSSLTLANNASEIQRLREDNKALLAKNADIEKVLNQVPEKQDKDSFNKTLAEESQKRADLQKMASLEAKTKELEIRNDQLEDTLRKSQTRIAETAINTETKSVQQIVDLQSKLDAAQQDNINLAKQLDSFKLQKEDKTLSLVAGDWDLEKATKRLNESEREIQRLGAQMEKDHQACSVEKAQIENMLFDPAVTEQKQIDRLAQLERDLKAAKNVAPSKEAIQELATLKSSLEAAKKDKDMAVAEKASLKSKADTLEASLKVEQAKGAGAVTQSAAVTAQMDELRKQVAEQAAIQAENAALKTKADTLEASLKAEQAKGAGAVTQSAAVTTQMEELRKQVATQAATTNDSEALRKEASELKILTGKLQAELLQAQSSSNGQTGQMAAIQRQLEGLRSQMAMKEQQTATYQNQLATLQHENQQLAAAAARAQKTVPVSTAANESYTNVSPAAGLSPRVQEQAQARLPKPVVEQSPQQDQVLRTVLQKAGLSTSGFTSVSSGFSGAKNYSWSEGAGLKGIAAVKPAGNNFDDSVAQYISYQKSLCKGDFASMPSPSVGSAAIKMSLYEVACVGGAQSTSASLLFYENANQFVAIANQANADDMDIAMDGRDKIAQAIRGM